MDSDAVGSETLDVERYGLDVGAVLAARIPESGYFIYINAKVCHQVVEILRIICIFVLAFHARALRHAVLIMQKY